MAFKQIVTNNENSAIIKSDNTLWMTGSNQHGQFGVGNGTDLGITFSVLPQYSISYSPTFVKVRDNVEKVALGMGSTTTFTMALTTDGKLLAAGSNGQGELGINDSVSNSIDQFSQTYQAVYDLNGQMAYDQDSNPIVEPVNDISDFTCSGYSCLVLKNDGTVWKSGDYPVFVKLEGASNISAISAGSGHVVMLSNTGILSVMGDNTNGQLGLGNNNYQVALTQVTDTNLSGNISGIKCGQLNTYVLKENGELWGVGENWSGQLGQGNIGTQTSFVLMSNFSQNDPNLSDSLISDISNVGCGSSHNVVLQSNGTLLAAGSNSSGAFGKDPVQLASSSNFIEIAKDLGIVVDKIAVGNAQTMLITNDGEIYVAGINKFNQLGNNTNAGTENANFPFTLLDFQDVSSSTEKKARFKVLHGMSTCFNDKNPVLLEGEWAYETDTGFLKIGDGVTKWTELEYKIDDNLEKRVENYRKKITDAMGIDETGKDEEAIVTEIVDGVKKLFTDIMSEDSVYSYTCADLP